MFDVRASEKLFLVTYLELKEERGIHLEIQGLAVEVEGQGRKT